MPAAAMVHMHGIDAVGQVLAFREREIDGGKAEPLAAARSPLDRSLRPPPVAELLGRFPHLAAP